MDTVVAATPRAARAEEWSLTLSALGIAHRIAAEDGAGFLVVVAASEVERAREALAGFDEDETSRREAPPAPAEEPAPWMTGAVVGLALLGFFAVTGRPAPGAAWFERGAAAAGLMLSAEPWRAVTALTLHLDAAHVAGNAAVLAILVPAIGQRLGPGLALALVLLAGATGNLLAALGHAPGHLAIGASTAGFGAIGILAALRLARPPAAGLSRWRPWTVPVASLLLLVMLGTSPGADVLAHAAGLVTGAAVGLAVGLLGARRPAPAAQAALTALTGLVVASAWWVAL